MHNYYMLPKPWTPKMSFANTAVNLACYVQYNDFSPPNFRNVSHYIYTLHTYNIKQCNNSSAICKNIVKTDSFFKRANQRTYLQIQVTELKENKYNPLRSYLAAKGSHITDIPNYKIEENANKPFFISNGYRHLHDTIQKQLHQKNCTLFFNCVPDQTGRFYTKTLR